MSEPTQLEAIRAGLVRTIRTIPSLNVPDNEAGGVLAPPAAIIWTPELSYFRGGTSGPGGRMGLTQWEVWVLASMADPGSAPVHLDRWASTNGPDSIPALFGVTGTVQTLGDLVDFALCQSFRRLNYEESQGVGCWGGAFTIDVQLTREAG